MWWVHAISLIQIILLKEIDYCKDDWSSKFLKFLKIDDSMIKQYTQYAFICQRTEQRHMSCLDSTVLYALQSFIEIKSFLTIVPLGVPGPIIQWTDDDVIHSQWLKIKIFEISKIDDSIIKIQKWFMIQDSMIIWASIPIFLLLTLLSKIRIQRLDFKISFPYKYSNLQLRIIIR